MIGVELSRELREAGLLWEPKVGDWWHGDHGVKVLSQSKFDKWVEWNKTRKRLVWTHKGMLWLPSLSQLLAEIEKRSYSWEMGLTTTKGGPLMPGEWKSGYWVEIFKSNKSVYLEDAGTPEEAAGKALLWILRGA